MWTGKITKVSPGKLNNSSAEVEFTFTDGERSNVVVEKNFSNVSDESIQEHIVDHINALEATDRQEAREQKRKHDLAAFLANPPLNVEISKPVDPVPTDNDTAKEDFDYITLQLQILEAKLKAAGIDPSTDAEFTELQAKAKEKRTAIVEALPVKPIKVTL